jgi:hypothetical protein
MAMLSLDQLVSRPQMLGAPHTASRSGTLHRCRISWSLASASRHVVRQDSHKEKSWLWTSMITLALWNNDIKAYNLSKSKHHKKNPS